MAWDDSAWRRDCQATISSNETENDAQMQMGRGVMKMNSQTKKHATRTAIGHIPDNDGVGSVQLNPDDATLAFYYKRTGLHNW